MWVAQTFDRYYTYALKGALSSKGTYETEGTFLTHTLFSAVPLAKAPVVETGYAPQRVTLFCPNFSTVAVIMRVSPDPRNDTARKSSPLIKPLALYI
jgi:hypothetical protein